MNPAAYPVTVSKPEEEEQLRLASYATAAVRFDIRVNDD